MSSAVGWKGERLKLNSAIMVCVLQGGWNRWSHLKKFGPLKMTAPDGEGQHFSATVSVPTNAHSIDFVLSNVPEGEGIYDNRGGLDYHLPVEGSEVLISSPSSLLLCPIACPPQHILYCTAMAGWLTVTSCLLHFLAPQSLSRQAEHQLSRRLLESRSETGPSNRAWLASGIALERSAGFTSLVYREPWMTD